MNNKNITYTSTLPSVLVEEVVAYAKKRNVSKNKVIEIALKKLFEEELRKDLQETFKLANEDKELTQMAEFGLNDYLEQLKELEK